MDLQRHGHFPYRLERFGERDLALVDLEPLRLERVRNVGGGDRAVQRVVLPDPPPDLDLGLLEPLRQRLGLLLLFGLADVGDLALALNLPPVPLGDGERQLARQQVIARIAVGYFHDIAAAAQFVDVLSQNHFHRWNPSSLPRVPKLPALPTGELHCRHRQRFANRDIPLSSISAKVAAITNRGFPLLAILATDNVGIAVSLSHRESTPAAAPA